MPQTDYAGLATSTTLLGTLLSSAGAGTVVTVVNATGWPTGASGLVFVGTFGRGTSSEEKILFSSRTGNNLTISQRGYDDTVAVTHQNGETVAHTNDATLLRTASAHIFDTTRNDHPQYARLASIGTFTAAQTFTGGATFRKAQSDVRTNVSLIVGRAVTTDAQSIEFTVGAAVGAIIGRRQSSDNLTFGFDGGTTYDEKMVLDTAGGLALTGGALATGAVTGFFYPRSCAGTPTGVPSAIPAGSVPMVYDTTGNKLWAYNGSWRSVALV